MGGHAPLALAFAVCLTLVCVVKAAVSSKGYHASSVHKLIAELDALDKTHSVEDSSPAGQYKRIARALANITKHMRLPLSLAESDNLQGRHLDITVIQNDNMVRRYEMMRKRAA